MPRAHAPQIHMYVEEPNSGAHFLYVESIYLDDEPELLALLVGAGATSAEQRVAPERGLTPNLSRAVELVYALEHPQHPTWLNPAELAEVEARYHARTGKHELHIQQLLDRMEGQGRGNWRAVVWLAAGA